MDSSDDSSIAGDPVLVDSDSMDSDGAVYHEEGGLTNEPAEPHICIESICGLCSRDIGPGEWAIACTIDRLIIPPIFSILHTTYTNGFSA